MVGNDLTLDQGVGTAIITLGEQGALLVSPERTIHVPAITAGPVVETTGAGDAFNGGLAVGLSRGLGIEEAVRLGCATAGLSVTRAGAAASMPTAEEVGLLLQNSGG